MKKYELIQDQTIQFGSRKLYRIRALRNFNDVKAGDIGGYVEGEHNLRHDGECWVFGNALICDKARMNDNARMYGDAQMFGNSRMHGNASMNDSAQMFGNARMNDNARMNGNAYISGNARMNDNACISGKARMYGDTYISGNARMYGDAKMFGNTSMRGNTSMYGNACMYGNAFMNGDAIASHPGHIFTASNVGNEYGTLTIAHGPSGIIITRGCFTGTVEEFIELSKQAHDAETAAEYAELIRIGSARVMRFIRQHPHP